MNAHATSSLPFPVLRNLLIFLFLVLPRWPGDSFGGAVSEAGSIPHPIWGGGEGLPTCPRTASASDSLLELPREWGGHKVRILTRIFLSSPHVNLWHLKKQIQFATSNGLRCFFFFFFSDFLNQNNQSQNHNTLLTLGKISGNLEKTELYICCVLVVSFRI